MIRGQCYFVGLRVRLWISVADQPLQHGFVFGRQGRRDQVLVGGQCDLILCNERHLFRDTGIDLVADGQKAEFLRIASCSRYDRAEKHPIETAIVIPPRSVVSLFDGSFQVALRGFLWPAGIGDMQGHNLLIGSGQHEKIAAC